MSGKARAVTLDLDPGRFRFSVWRNVSFTIWTAQMTKDAGERVLRISRELNEQFPEGRSQVMVVADGALPPDQAFAVPLGVSRLAWGSGGWFCLRLGLWSSRTFLRTIGNVSST